MAFDWFKKVDKSEDKTKQEARRPNTRDLSEPYSVNRSLTMGLYHNQYPGLKLAGGLVFPMLSLPVYFMGFPSVKSDNEAIAEAGNEIIESMITQIQHINLCCHREGTIWVFPVWDSDAGRLRWEFIVDDSVSDIVQDIKTDKIKAIMTDEKITVRVSRNKTGELRRQRTFTADEITDEYSETQLKGYDSVLMRNQFGIMPVGFVNNAETNSVRGNSDLTRVLPLLKVYHDVSLAEYQILAQFRTKLVQTTKNVDTWLANNGYESISDVDVSGSDLILNIEGEETNFVSAKDAVLEYRSTKKQIFQQMVETSGVPEILWGVKTEGNHASANENMETLVMFTKDKQRQKTEAYRRLVEYSLRLTGVARMSDMSGAFDIVWNDIDGTSDQTKAEIFKNFAAGAKNLLESGALTIPQLHQLWEMMYPGIDSGSEEEFEKGIKQTASLLQFMKASYTDALDAQGMLAE